VRVIAIDGPAGAGKSTVARQVSTATGLRYLDTGAMYRCVALEVQNTATDPNNADAVGKIARDVNVVIERDAAKLTFPQRFVQVRSMPLSALSLHILLFVMP
jgi:cytidylate kinase